MASSTENTLDDEKKKAYLGHKDIFEKYIRLLIKEGAYQDAVNALKSYEGAFDSVFLLLWDEAHYLWQQASTGQTLTPIQKYRIRKRFPPPPSICPDGERPRTNFDYMARKILKSWFHQHKDHPYPSMEDKQSLAGQTGLSVIQINSWFGNARRRWRARHGLRDFMKPKKMVQEEIRKSRRRNKGQYQTNSEECAKTAETQTSISGAIVELSTHLKNRENFTSLESVGNTAEQLTEFSSEKTMVTRESGQADSTVERNNSQSQENNLLNPRINSRAEHNKVLRAYEIHSHLEPYNTQSMYSLSGHNEDLILKETPNGSEPLTNGNDTFGDGINLLDEDTDNTTNTLEPPEVEQTRFRQPDKLSNDNVDQIKHSLYLRNRTLKKVTKYRKFSSVLFDANESSKKLDYLNILKERFLECETKKRLNSKTKLSLGRKLKKRKGWEDEFYSKLKYKPLIKESIDAKQCIDGLQGLCNKIDRDTVSPRDAAVNMVIQDINNALNMPSNDSEDPASYSEFLDQNDTVGHAMDIDTPEIKSDETNEPVVEDMLTIDLASVGCIEVEVENISADQVQFPTIYSWQPTVHCHTGDTLIQINSNSGDECNKVLSAYEIHRHLEPCCIQSSNCDHNGWIDSVQALAQLSESECTEKSEYAAVDQVCQTPRGNSSPKQASSDCHESCSQNGSFEWMYNVGCPDEMRNEEGNVDPPNQLTQHTQGSERPLSGEEGDGEDFQAYTIFKESSQRAANQTNMEAKVSYSTVVGEAVEGLLNLSSSQELDINTQYLDKINVYHCI